ncbi:MAG: hypothetical protein DRP02_02405 [Candidatus Gerdarchaeota archaeon]|nr:MAG: hypothetical protein DRP02_02405 [Candidatus Gerdarchaeota archaeon]
MAQCQAGWSWSKELGRCIKVRTKSETVPVPKAVPRSPRTGTGFTSDGIEIVKNEDAGDISERFGATSKVRGEPLAGSRSGTQKILANQGMTGFRDVTGTGVLAKGTENLRDKKGFAFLQDPAPSQGENEDAKDFAVREARWEASQAIKQANAVAKSTEQIRGDVESRQRTDTEALFRQKGKIGGLGTVTNPAYTALTTEQKRLNAGLPEDQQIKETIEISEKDLTAEQIAAMNAGTNVRITDEQRQAKFTAAAGRETFTDPETGKTVKGNIEANLFRVKDLLGAEAGDKLDIREDGSYFLRDEEGEEVDPVLRAELKVQKEADDARDTLNEAYRVTTDRIKSQHSTDDGNLTDQGVTEMQKAQKEYNKNSEKLEEKIDDALDETIRSEKNRQIQVDTAIEASKAGKKALSFAEEVSKSKVNRLNELKAQGKSDMVALAQVEREYAQMKDDPQKIELNEFISGLDESGVEIDDQFGAVYAKAGNDTKAAYDAMKTRYGEFEAKRLQSDFLKKNGWSEKQVERKDIKATINDFWTGQVVDPDAVGNFMEQLEDLGYSDSFKKKQLNAMIISPTLNNAVKDEARAILEEDFDGGGGAGDLTFEQQLNIPSIGRMLYGARISDKETERVQNIVTAPEAAGLDRFGLIQRILGFNVKENVELGEALMNQIIAVSPEEGLASFDMLGLAKLLNSGNTDGAVRKVENFSNALARKTEGENFVSEAFVAANVRKYNKVERELEDFGATFGLGPITGTLSNWFGRAKESEQKKIGAMMNSAVAKMRNELLGSAVTPAEERFLEDVLPKATDTPSQIVAKLDNLKENALIELNSMREIYGMPTISEEALLDKGLKKDLYTITKTTPEGATATAATTGGDLFALTVSNEGNPTSHNLDKGLDGGEFQSHGSFQMNRGTASSFASWLGFENTDPESPEFAREWDEKSSDPDFIKNEQAFIKRTHFDPQIAKLTEAKYPQGLINDMRFQQMVMDVAVNAGAGTDLIITALRGKKIRSVDDALRLITEERKKRIKGHEFETGLNDRFEKTLSSLSSNKI